MVLSENVLSLIFKRCPKKRKYLTSVEEEIVQTYFPFAKKIKKKNQQIISYFV